MAIQLFSRFMVFTLTIRRQNTRIAGLLKSNDFIAKQFHGDVAQLVRAQDS